MRVLSAFPLILLVAACAERAPAPTARLTSAEAVPAGERIARRECGGCHSVDGRQPSPLADAPAFPALRARLSRDQLAAALEARSVEAHRRMPRLQLDEDELTYLLDYWDDLAPETVGP